MFRAGEKDDIMVVIDKYLDLAIHYDYPFVMVKYCVQQMMGSLQDTPQGRFFKINLMIFRSRRSRKFHNIS